MRVSRGCSVVGVEAEGHTLEYPVGNMLVSLDVSNEDETLAHGVLSVLSDIHRSLDGVSQL